MRVLENLEKTSIAGQTCCAKYKLRISIRNMAHNFKKQIIPDTQVLSSGMIVVFPMVASQYWNHSPKFSTALENWHTTNYQVSLSFDLLTY